MVTPCPAPAPSPSSPPMIGSLCEASICVLSYSTPLAKYAALGTFLRNCTRYHNQYLERSKPRRCPRHPIRCNLSLFPPCSEIRSVDVVTLSRLQFALTIMFHYIFPPLTIGLGVVLVYLEGMYLRTK